MARLKMISSSLILLAVLATGCGKSEPTAVSELANGAATAPTQQSPPTDPAARVAYDFLAAVLKGNEQQVTASLTPKAAQQLNEREQRFPMPGIDSTTFQIGEVRKPAENQALVQCLLIDVSKEKPGTSEEICCLLRLVENQWRVSGLAFGSAQGRPTILDFEAPPTQPMLPTAPQVDATPAPAVGRPSPPRMANETFAPPTSR